MIEHVSPPASMLREAAQRASAPTVRSSDAERAEGHPGVFRGTTAVSHSQGERTLGGSGHLSGEFFSLLSALQARGERGPEDGEPQGSTTRCALGSVDPSDCLPLSTSLGKSPAFSSLSSANRVFSNPIRSTLT